MKYAKAGASEKEIRALADEAREQLLRYSEDELVAEAKAKGELKLITIVWRSWELALLEEVTLSCEISTINVTTRFAVHPSHLILEELINKEIAGKSIE